MNETSLRESTRRSVQPSRFLMSGRCKVSIVWLRRIRPAHQKLGVICPLTEIGALTGQGHTTHFQVHDGNGNLVAQGGRSTPPLQLSAYKGDSGLQSPIDTNPAQ
jgi:hypothetical protein